MSNAVILLSTHVPSLLNILKHKKSTKIRLQLQSHNSLNILKNTELYILNGHITWHVTYVLIKLLKKKTLPKWNI